MPFVDRIVAVIVLAATGGVLVFRAARAWMEFRRQRRAVDVLVRSMAEIERPAKERRE